MGTWSDGIEVFHWISWILLYVLYVDGLGDQPFVLFHRSSHFHCLRSRSDFAAMPFTATWEYCNVIIRCSLYVWVWWPCGCSTSAYKRWLPKWAFVQSMIYVQIMTVYRNIGLWHWLADFTSATLCLLLLASAWFGCTEWTWPLRELRPSNILSSIQIHGERWTVARASVCVSVCYSMHCFPLLSYTINAHSLLPSFCARARTRCKWNKLPFCGQLVAIHANMIDCLLLSFNQIPALTNLICLLFCLASTASLLCSAHTQITCHMRRTIMCEFQYDVYSHIQLHISRALQLAPFLVEKLFRSRHTICECAGEPHSKLLPGLYDAIGGEMWYALFEW